MEYLVQARCLQILTDFVIILCPTATARACTLIVPVDLLIKLTRFDNQVQNTGVLRTPVSGREPSLASRTMVSHGTSIW